MEEGHSLTEFVRFRYGRAKYWLALVIAVFYMFVFLSAETSAFWLIERRAPLREAYDFADLASRVKLLEDAS